MLRAIGLQPELSREVAEILWLQGHKILFQESYNDGRWWEHIEHGYAGCTKLIDRRLRLK